MVIKSFFLKEIFENTQKHIHLVTLAPSLISLRHFSKTFWLLQKAKMALVIG